MFNKFFAFLNKETSRKEISHVRLISGGSTQSGECTQRWDAILTYFF